MRNFRRIQVSCLIAAAICWAGSAAALTLRIDYAYDTTSFFGNGNPLGEAAGIQARAAVDAAAAFYTGILNDSLLAIQTPPKFFGSLGGEATWSWRARFPHPTDNGRSTTVPNLSVPANEYVVFVGARELGPNELGLGGPGAWDPPSVSTNGNFTALEFNQIQQTQNQFASAVTTRGETIGFVDWGGALAIDRDTNWHFDHTTPVPAGKLDLYSVALHELAHTLGFGTSAAWNSFVSGTTFIGPEAMDSYHLNGPVPLASATNTSHWSLSNTGSRVFDTNTPQQSLMSPSIPSGLRRLLTNLDAAALVDVGWEINLPEPLPGDYNGNGLVDAADYIVWRDTLASTTNLQANGDNSGGSAGVIDQADYLFWKARFGQGAGSGGSAGSVPEPANILLLVAAAVTAGLAGRGGWGRRGRRPSRGAPIPEKSLAISPRRG